MSKKIIKPVRVISKIVWSDAYTDEEGFYQHAESRPQITIDYPEIGMRDVTKNRNSIKPNILLVVVEVDDSVCEILADDLNYFVLDGCEQGNVIAWLALQGVSSEDTLIENIGLSNNSSEISNFVRDFCNRL